MFVTEAFVLCSEKKPEICPHMSKLFLRGMQELLLTADIMKVGLTDLFDMAEDLMLDSPQVLEYCGQIIAPLLSTSSELTEYSLFFSDFIKCPTNSSPVTIGLYPKNISKFLSALLFQWSSNTVCLFSTILNMLG